MPETILHVGFDDTDSPKGMCTTFLAYKIVDFLKKQETEFLDYPRLVRFNPNIPWKTRGNGAVSISMRTKNPKKIKNKIKQYVKKYSDVRNGANPGLVFFESSDIPPRFAEFSRLALWQLISRSMAKKFAKENNLEYFFEGNGQGLVGAIGAIGYDFEDHTLELLTYRKISRFGTKRIISSESVKKMQEKTHPFTFNSYDKSHDQVLITPHGPDPVFYGVRGENIHSLLSAKQMLKTEERLDGYLVFKSNQGTGDHLKNNLNPSQLRPYSSGIIQGRVSKLPKTIIGGHVLFSVETNGTEINCGVYKPTGIANIANCLVVGDNVRFGGGVRKASKNYPRIFNVEFLEVLKLEKQFYESNPFCSFCKKNMKSKGTYQGFECVKCQRKASSKTIKQIPRNIEAKLYTPHLTAHRHLSRPLVRINKKNTKSQFKKSDVWFSKFR